RRYSCAFLPRGRRGVQCDGRFTGRAVVVDARHAGAYVLTLIRAARDRLRRDLAPAARHAGSDLLQDVAFDKCGGQGLRRTGVPTLALGAGAGVVAIATIAAADLGRRHGTTARPTKEQALQKGLRRRSDRSRTPRTVLSQKRLDFLPSLKVDDRRLFSGMDLVAIAHPADVGDVGQQTVETAARKRSSAVDTAFSGHRLLGTPTPPIH